MQMYEYLASIVNAQLKNSCPLRRPEQVPFDEIVNIANRNHISYMVFSVLVKEDGLNERQLEYLRNRVKDSVFRSLVQSTELSTMEKKFEERSIKNMPIKGAVLKSIYPKQELREMSDIDVLIDEESIYYAGMALEEMGYSLASSIKHHDIYCKGRIMTIEAHKSLYDKTVDNTQYEYFSGFDKAVLRNNCMYTYEFKPEDFYVYLVAHAAKHFYAMGCGIRNLIDIYVFLSKYRKDMDMEYTRNELKRCGIADFAYHMEKLAFDWIDGKKLDDFYLSLFQYMQDAGIYGKDENGIWNKFCDEKKDKISKWELKVWYFLPPLYYMSEYYPWLEDRPFLLPIAWLIRFFRGIFLHKGVEKREMVKNIKQDQIMTYKRIYQRMNLKFSNKAK